MENNGVVRPNLAVIGTLYPTKEESNINYQISKLNNEIYWLPWGFRFQTLTKVLNHLKNNGYWNCKRRFNLEKIGYFLYEKNVDIPLVFFHYDSKAQGGRGLIYYKYHISKVIKADYPITIVSQKISYKPVMPSSKVWFAVEKVKDLRSSLHRDGYMLQDFNINPLFVSSDEREVSPRKDGAFLYYQVLPIKEPYHTDNNDCTCLLCI